MIFHYCCRRLKKPNSFVWKCAE